MSTDAARAASPIARRCPTRSTSSTRPCATAPSSRASRSPSTTSCASPSSSTGSASRWIEGGYPQANPKDEEFFRRAPTELDARAPPSWWRSARPGARPGKVDVDPTLARPGRAPARRTVCIVGKCWDFHVTEALRTTLDEGVAMVGESVAFLKAEGLRVFFDAEHFFDGYKANPEFALRVLEAAAMATAPTAWCCATPTAARCPTRCSASSARSCRYFGARPASASTPRTTPGCAVANSRRRRASAAPPRCRARSTATASAPATPTS